MSAPVRPWYRRPWAVTGAVIGGLVLIGFVAFIGTVIRYTLLFTSGKLDPKALRQQQFHASVSKRFSEANVANADLSRIEPKGSFPSLGNPEAAVRIVEFADYACPWSRSVAPVVREYMARHATDTFFILRDFPIQELHAQGEEVAVAADCVFKQDPKKYWIYHDRLFASQEAQSPDDLRLYALQLGLDAAAYDACVRKQLPLADIRKSLEDGVAAGVQGTPTFFFNGVKIQGAPDADTFALIVDEARKRVGK